MPLMEKALVWSCCRRLSQELELGALILSFSPPDHCRATKVRVFLANSSALSGPLQQELLIIGFKLPSSCRLKLPLKEHRPLWGFRLATLMRPSVCSSIA